MMNKNFYHWAPEKNKIKELCDSVVQTMFMNRKKAPPCQNFTGRRFEFDYLFTGEVHRRLARPSCRQRLPH